MKSQTKGNIEIRSDKMQRIIDYLDRYLEATGRSFIAPVEGNAVLVKAGLLRDDKENPGKPLRDKLRKGLLPHAYQIGGKGSSWIIPHSSSRTEPIKNKYSSESVESNKIIEAEITQHILDIDVNDLKKQLEQARLKYKPDRVKLLLIAEAPPDNIERFFYYEKVREHDYLFLGVAQALYPEMKDRYLNSGRSSRIKAEILLQLKKDGFYLLDLSELPLRYATGNLSEQLPALMQKIEGVIDNETRIILIKANVYDIAFHALEGRFGCVVNERIPFPGQGWQNEFQRSFQQALKAANYHG